MSKQKKYNQDYYLKNKERLNIINKEYYNKNKEYLKITQKAWNDNNKERLANAKMVWAEKNKERMDLWHKEYRKLNKENIAKRNKAYRELIKINLPKPYTRPNARYQKLKKRYNLHVQDVFLMLVNQNNRCLICDKEFTKKNKFNIDHNHATGKVRELLCCQCNYGLGRFFDNKLFLNNAIEYLEKFNK